jgi:hypothetical protein
LSDCPVRLSKGTGKFNILMIAGKLAVRERDLEAPAEE